MKYLIRLIFIKLLISSIILFVLIARVFSQDLSENNSMSKVELIKGIKSSMYLPSSIINLTEYTNWLSRMKPALQAAFKGEEDTYYGAVGITIYSDKPADFVLCCNQPCPTRIKNIFKNYIDLQNCPRTVYGENALLIYFSTNADHPIDFKIKENCLFEFPSERRLRKFIEMEFKEKRDFLINWPIKELIPTMSLVFAEVDSEYSEIREFSEILKDYDIYFKKPVESITDSSTIYWNSVLEMAPSDYSIIITKILLYISHGEFGYAKRLIDLVKLFPYEACLAQEYLHEIDLLLGIYQKTLEDKILKGIQAYDQGNYDLALDRFIKIVAVDPSSAWCWHELLLTKKTLNFFDADEDDYNSLVYHADPLYPMGLEARNAIEGFHMERRMRINELFQNPDSLLIDLTQYSEIALDVGQYGMSAEICWLVLPFLPNEKGQQMLNVFLFCLEQMGVSEIKTNFKGEHELRFYRVEESIHKRMDLSPLYNAMKGK